MEYDGTACNFAAWSPSSSRSHHYRHGAPDRWGSNIMCQTSEIFLPSLVTGLGCGPAFNLY